MAEIFLVGSSGHAKVVLDIVRKEGLNSVVGIIDSYAAPGSIALGLPVLGDESQIAKLAAQFSAPAAIVAIGDNFIRHTMVAKIRALDPEFAFASAVHPSVQIGAGVRIGIGTVIMAGAVVNPDTLIGEHCIVNTHASVDHDNVMEDFSSIAPGAITGGNVRIGRFSAVSIAASIIHGRSVGCHSVIGAGAAVLHDIPNYVVAYGTPARVQKTRQPGDKYL